MIGIGYDLLLYLHAQPAPMRPISLSPSLNKMPTLRSATFLASLWPCHQCSHLNDSSMNKKCCFSCQARKDGLAQLSAKGGSTSTSRAAAPDIRRRACWQQQRILPRQEWPVKQRIPSQGRESNREGGKEKTSISRIRRSIVSAATTIASSSTPNASNHNIPIVGV